MKKLLLILMALLLTTCTCFAEMFKNFEEEKNFCVSTAWKKVESLGEKPIAWYTNHSSFTKAKYYTAAIIKIKCANNKLAHCHVQFRVDEGFFTGKETLQVYVNDATITHNYYNY